MRRASILATASLALCTFLLTRHAQIDGLTALLAPMVLATALAGARASIDTLVLLPAVLFTLISLAASALKGVPAEDSMRFALIVLGTLLATQWGGRRVSLPWVLLPVALQSLGITAVSLYLGIVQDTELALGMRAFALDANWGDIYTLNGWYYRVQLVGNALIPLAFMICLHRWNTRGRRGLAGAAALLFAVGVVAAGNLTYAIVCVTYAAYLLARRSRTARRIMAGALVVSIAALFASGAVEDIVENKFDGSDSSMGVRFDQVDVLVEAFADSPVQTLLGHGIGTRYPNGKQRNYSESQYIELQVLYVTYQLGLVGMALVFGAIAYMLHRKMTPAGQGIFWMYVVSGITNPYILDTNQMVATMLLSTCARTRLEEA